MGPVQPDSLPLRCEYQDIPPGDPKDNCEICTESFNLGSRRRVVHLERRNSNNKICPICKECLKKLETSRCPTCRELIDRVSVYSFMDRIQLRIQTVFLVVFPTIVGRMISIAGRISGILGRNLIPFVVSANFIDSSAMEFLLQQYRQNIPIGSDFFALIVFLSSFVGLRIILIVASEMTLYTLNIRDLLRENGYSVKPLSQFLPIILTAIMTFPFKRYAEEYARYIARFTVQLLFWTEVLSRFDSVFITAAAAASIFVLVSHIMIQVERYMGRELQANWEALNSDVDELLNNPGSGNRIAAFIES